MASHFDYEKLDKWEEETHIPTEVMKIVEAVCKNLGIYVEETTITYYNRGGYSYAYAKGFEISYCTSSLIDGPSENMAPVFMQWLQGLGFKIADSYGDNGMDSATNWHDTFWHTKIAYTPSKVYEEEFIWWDDEEN